MYVSRCCNSSLALLLSSRFLSFRLIRSLYPRFLVLEHVSSSSNSLLVSVPAPFSCCVVSCHLAVQFAIDDINADPTILPNTTLRVKDYTHYFTPAVSRALASLLLLCSHEHSPQYAIQVIMQLSFTNQTLVWGNLVSDTALATAVTGSVYGVAELGSTVGNTVLSNKKLFPD